MNSYEIHLTNKETRVIRAFSYTEEDNRIIFHKKEDKTDSDSYFRRDQIAGIDNLGEV